MGGGNIPTTAAEKAIQVVRKMLREKASIIRVWAYDFMLDATADGRRLRVLTIKDEFARESPAIEVMAHARGIGYRCARTRLSLRFLVPKLYLNVLSAKLRFGQGREAASRVIAFPSGSLGTRKRGNEKYIAALAVSPVTMFCASDLISASDWKRVVGNTVLFILGSYFHRPPAPKTLHPPG